MNKKRFIISTLVGFALLFVLDFVIHGVLLMPTYEQTADVWRSKEGYESLMLFSTVIHLAIAATLCFIYTRHHEGKGIKEGIRFGLMTGCLIGLIHFSSYA
ncbi:MAG: hypothetical protein HRT94_04320 [Alphaproteobacteria bacterium]|nr:hypothetical protein [Alphaproteobacteria bacterium]